MANKKILNGTKYVQYKLKVFFIANNFPNTIQIFIYFNTDTTPTNSCEKKLKFFEGNEIKDRGYLIDSL